MANEIRLRADFIGGKVDDNPLTSTATTLNSSALAACPAVDSSHHFPITVDPDGIFGSPEIIYVTALTAGATSATIARAQEGTTARQHNQDEDWVHTPTIKDYDGAAGGSGLIGFTQYNPGTAVQPSTTSSTYSAVDATNLKVVFTAPPSGKVLISLCARAYQTGADWQHWGLLDVGNSNALVANTDAQVGSPNNNVRATHRCVVTGLTPGTVYTYAWGFKNESNSVAVDTIYGGASGPAVMEVWAVNL